MRKLLAIILLVKFFCVSLVADDKYHIFNELQLQTKFLETNDFKSKYKELSSLKKINYYDNLIKKFSISSKIVQDELEAQNLPEAFFFIPLIESNFSNKVSKSGPVGIWQIMPLTANILKLKRDEFVDERLDLVQSTKAATSYLKKYYKKFGKWYLSVLAYNAGEGRIIHGVARATLDNYLENNPTMYHDKVIKLYNLYINDYKHSKKGIDNLYIIYKDLGVKLGYFDYVYLLKHNNKRDYLPKTSVKYINMLSAFSIIAGENKFSNLKHTPRYELYKTDAPKGYSIKAISDALQIDFSEFKALNKHFIKDIIPNNSKKYNLYFPGTKKELFEALALSNKNIQVVKPNIDKKEKTTIKSDVHIHKVQNGDTLYVIAKKYGVSVKKLKKDNKKKSDRLKIGEIIEIYK